MSFDGLKEATDELTAAVLLSWNSDVEAAFAAHLTERGLTSCGPIVAVREFIAWRYESATS